MRVVLHWEAIKVDIRGSLGFGLGVFVFVFPRSDEGGGCVGSLDVRLGRSRNGDVEQSFDAGHAGEGEGVVGAEHRECECKWWRWLTSEDVNRECVWVRRLMEMLEVWVDRQLCLGCGEGEGEQVSS